ncbi:ABC transporter ATP-binding protein [Actinomadura sp. KC06]|uniref:ABC transporter ATP-binding protein n=1 Tax=Actinomadura sp. KC06 TaxID=2530369 RepID=UPI0010509C07|nr:ABC transporter ATP-binding protein [Actinomadura sp. KC06]TDD34137.1 ABC transporter ATP-binding protein [Actinomadura sp. KC06]
MTQADGGARPARPVLAGADLAKNYGRTTALHHASLVVDRGESVAVMGPSGSGKSTLLYCLSGVVMPDGGEVVFDGVRVDELSDAGRTDLRRSDFGFVFQFPGLLPELSAVENAALPLMLDGTARRDAVARARELFPSLGLDGLERRRPGELSGGEAQRVGIARALVLAPAVVFADEPTGSLDTRTGDEVISLLVSTVKDRQAALVLVTHDERVAKRCDRIVQVVDGRTLPEPKRVQ